MTKQELEKAIEKGESVWYSGSDKVVKIDLSEKNKYDIQECSIFNDNYIITALVINYTFHYLLKYLFKTKAEAEHYLHHANIVRTEELPFLTWEEFKEQKQFTFIGRSSLLYRMRIEQFDDKYLIFLEHYFMESFNVSRVWDLTEANFYKAYDEAVRLFKQE